MRNANRSHSSTGTHIERPHLPFDAIEALADYDASMTLQYNNLTDFKLPIDKIANAM